MATPPAGWHPDPYGRYEARYWDGTRWTEQVASQGRPTVDPLGATTSVPFATPSTAWGAPGGSPAMSPPGYVPYGQVPATGKPPRSGFLVAAGVLALVIGGFFALFAVGAAIGAATAPDDDWIDLRGAFFVVAAVLGAIAALYITAGVGGCRRRGWGKVMLIICFSLVALPGLGALSGRDAAGGALFFLVLGGTGLGLSIAGRPYRD